MKSFIGICLNLLVFNICFLSGKNRPNIIYLNADDLGVMDVGFMGE